ncbi:hypothetical protein TWF281_004108 [Arthrobotrys megalospora]
MQLPYPEGLEVDLEPIIISPFKISAMRSTHEPEMPSIIITPPPEAYILPAWFNGSMEKFYGFEGVAAYKRSVEHLTVALSLLQLAEKNST